MRETIHSLVIDGVLIALVIVISIGLIYSIYKDMVNSEKRFHLQIEATKAQTSMTNPLKFEDCRSIINSIVNFYCVMEDVTRGHYKKTPEEFSLDMDKVITKVALDSRMALSDELVRQFGKFATVDGEGNYLETYILNTTKIALMDEVNRRRSTTSRMEPMVPKNTPSDHKKK